MTAIIDYGVGNLFSLKSSFNMIGEEAVVTADPARIAEADRIILPGVGAFMDAYKKLVDTGMAEVVIDAAKSGKPLMGICLGMQLLFDKSYEYGECPGLSLIPGEVVPMKGVIDDSLQIPHIGWNALSLKGKSEIFKYIEDGDCVYFVHSYFATNCEKNTIATCEYDKDLTAAVARGNVFGCQFHPEKSGQVGLKILKAFCEL